MLGPSQRAPAPVANGVQTAAHQNGVSANGGFEEMIQLNNGANPAQTQSARVGEPILAFEAGDSFRMKTGPMKPQHVAGTAGRTNQRGADRGRSQVPLEALQPNCQCCSCVVRWRRGSGGGTTWGLDNSERSEWLIATDRFETSNAGFWSLL